MSPTGLTPAYGSAVRNGLAKHPASKRLPGYWREFTSDLATGFADRCAYGAMWVSDGTVDHFISVDEDRSLAYEWGNYRFCSGWLNSVKQNVPSARLLDPFEVQPDWFRISLPSLQLEIAADRIPAAALQRAKDTIERLHLRDDERIIRQRQAWYAMYTSGELTLAGLEKKAPLIAAAVRRQT